MRRDSNFARSLIFGAEIVAREVLLGRNIDWSKSQRETHRNILVHRTRNKRVLFLFKIVVDVVSGLPDFSTPEIGPKSPDLFSLPLVKTLLRTWKQKKTKKNLNRN